MIIYILAFILILGLYSPISKRNNGKKIYCVVICIVLTMIVGLRNINMGLTDTQYVYYPRFFQILNYPFAYIFTLKDYGFQALTFLFTRVFGANFKLYTVLFAFPYVGATSFLIYKYSNKPWLSYIMFMCLQYFEIAFTLMRQVMGMAFLCIAIHYFIKEKYKTFILFVVIASLFHQICLVFVVLLGINYIKPKRWMLIPLLFIIGLCLVYPQQLLGFAYRLIDYDRFLRYSTIGSSKNLTFFFINAVIFLAESLVFNRIKNNRGSIVFFVCSCICLAVSPLTIALGEMSRVAYLFGLFNIILLPQSIERFKAGGSRGIAATAYTIVFIGYFLVFLGPQVNIIPYYF